MQELEWIEKYLLGKMEIGEILSKISPLKERELLLEISASFDLFSEGREGIHFFSKKFSVQDEVMLYPGSFFPWHEGHSECLKQSPIPYIIIIPDRNPEKDFYSERPLETYLRLLAIKEIQNFQLYPGFLILKAANPTAVWMKKIKFKKKNLLVGDDSFMNLHQWIKAEDLIKSLASISVLPRQYQSSDYKKQEENLKKMNPNLTITYLNDHPYKGTSSRSIRSSKQIK